MFCYESIFMKNSKLRSIYHWECYKFKKNIQDRQSQLVPQADSETLPHLRKDFF